MGKWKEKLTMPMCISCIYVHMTFVLNRFAEQNLLRNISDNKISNKDYFSTDIHMEGGETK